MRPHPLPSVSSAPPSSSEGPVDQEMIDEWCRRANCSEFAEIVSRLSYSEVYQVHAELSLRMGKISSQLETRESYAQDWKIKATSALNIIRQKLDIAGRRLKLMRDNHILNLVSKIGIETIKSSRLLLIKCLVHIINNHLKVKNFSVEEKAVFDACLHVTDQETEPKFSSMNYNVTTNSITDSNNVEVAMITSAGYMTEENGELLASSSDALDLLSSLEPMMAYLKNNSRCKPDGHSPQKCLHCEAESLYMETVDFISNNK